MQRHLYQGTITPQHLRAQDPGCPMKLVVAVGSYERILYGIDVELSKEGKVSSTKESFAIPAHTGYLKTVSSCPRFLVSGATDETISGSEDGRIGLFRTKDWECLHVLRHKKPVTAIAVHPSGKVALSVGKEKSIKLWNLMTGKQAHSSLLSHEPLQIQFSESGKYYAVLSDFNLVIYETETTKKILDFKSKTRLACMAVLRDELVFIAGEGSLIQMVEISLPDPPAESTSKVTILETEQSPRVKGLSIVSGAFGDVLVSASSSGLIKGWSLPDQQEIFSHPSNVRIICLTATIQE
ncbi:hypothetical protein PSACC_00284 [Paramicrosporidium saccamoebae]|uniref:Uncharacterized protein n=1 Tax=Paramicrosporidium saccamoebae TaxID=1246581 RepID=A0A2H9TQ88_9FUNG|nr:hypothetical protein PSACC_00284 [Paramicrosporidium saccamoebae]